MPLTKLEKQARVDALHGELAQATALIVATFDHLTVAQDYELRKQVRAAGARYLVLKNTLAERAAQGTGVGAVLRDLKGVTSIAYTRGDAVALAKTLQKYAKDNPALTCKVGYVDGQSISLREIEQLAALPSREELLAKVLFLIQAPAQRLVTVLNAVGRNTAVVLDQAVRQNKFGE